MTRNEKLDRAVALLEEYARSQQEPEKSVKAVYPGSFEDLDEAHNNFKIDTLTYLLCKYPGALDEYYNKRLEGEKKFQDGLIWEDPDDNTYGTWEVPLPGASASRNIPTTFMGKGARCISDWGKELEDHHIAERINWHLSEIQKLFNKKIRTTNDK